MSVVFRSIKICSMVDDASTCGDRIEVENRDLGQPIPIHIIIHIHIQSTKGSEQGFHGSDFWDRSTKRPVKTDKNN